MYQCTYCKQWVSNYPHYCDYTQNPTTVYIPIPANPIEKKLDRIIELLEAKAKPDRKRRK